MTSPSPRPSAPASGRPALAEPTLPGRLRLRLLGLAGETARPELRGFVVDDPAVSGRLTRIGEIFLAGYRAGLLDPRPEHLLAVVDAVPTGWRGFAWEGVGFALAVIDTLSPRRHRPGRLAEMIAGPGAPHVYLLVVGSGWALARLPKRIGRHLRSLDPRLAWLALDGFGFHQGYFDHARAIARHRLPRRLARRARWGFDVGLGRSLWFLQGASPERVAALVGRFPVERQADLWSGVGIASAYAGGVGRPELERLIDLAGPRSGDLAQGVTFAAKARSAGADPAPQTELACRVVWGMGAEATSAVTDRMMAEAERRMAGRPDDALLSGLPGVDGSTAGGEAEPFLERWRRGIREEYRKLRPAPH